MQFLLASPRCPVPVARCRVAAPKGREKAVFGGDQKLRPIQSLSLPDFRATHTIDSFARLPLARVRRYRAGPTTALKPLMMRRHRSNQRPSSRAVARPAAGAIAVPEVLEGRHLLSGGAPLPLSALPYLYIGPVFQFSRETHPHVAQTAAAVGKGKASHSVQVAMAAAGPAQLSVSVPPVVAAQTEADRPSITGSYPANGTSNIAPDAFIAADLFFPVAGAVIDPSTLNSNNVRLIRTRD